MFLTSAQYEHHCENDDGYCEECDKITAEGGIEPDAEEYKCGECGKHSLMGMETAMIKGFLDIEGEE